MKLQSNVSFIVQEYTLRNAEKLRKSVEDQITDGKIRTDIYVHAYNIASNWIEGVWRQIWLVMRLMRRLVLAKKVKKLG